jgi:hypothetical protein
MNCSQVCAELPALVYGDLKPEEAAPLRKHLDVCPACRREQAALQQLRRILDAVPTPQVEVDLPQLYRQAAAQQECRLRRWRRAAVALAAVAAGLALLAFGHRLEVQLEPHQAVFRWGSAPSTPGLPRTHAAQASLNPEGPASQDPAEQLRLLSELVRALAREQEASDQRQQNSLARLESRVADLQDLANERWTTTQRNVAALYAAHVLQSQKGATR